MSIINVLERTRETHKLLIFNAVFLDQCSLRSKEIVVFMFLFFLFFINVHESIIILQYYYISADITCCLVLLVFVLDNAKVADTVTRMYHLGDQLGNNNSVQTQ